MFVVTKQKTLHLSQQASTFRIEPECLASMLRSLFLLRKKCLHCQNHKLGKHTFVQPSRSIKQSVWEQSSALITRLLQYNQIENFS